MSVYNPFNTNEQNRRNRQSQRIKDYIQKAANQDKVAWRQNLFIKKNPYPTPNSDRKRKSNGKPVKQAKKFKLDKEMPRKTQFKKGRRYYNLGS